MDFKGIQQVLDHLYIGPEEVSRDLEYLLQYNIRAIVTLTNNVQFPDNFKYLPIDAVDSPIYNLYDKFDDIIKFIDEYKNSNLNVLVHCNAGVSRSGSCLIAYVMRELRYDYDMALEFVKSKRSFVSPNIGFEMQLRNYQMKLGIVSSKCDNVLIHIDKGIFSSTHRSIFDFALLQKYGIDLILTVETGLELFDSKFLNIPIHNISINPGDYNDIIEKLPKIEEIIISSEKKNRILICGSDNSVSVIASLIAYFVRSKNYSLKRSIDQISSYGYDSEINNELFQKLDIYFSKDSYQNDSDQIITMLDDIEKSISDITNEYTVNNYRLENLLIQLDSVNTYGRDDLRLRKRNLCHNITRFIGE